MSEEKKRKRTVERIADELRDGTFVGAAPSAEERAATLPLIAKKDFEIHQNDTHILIRAGDDLSKIPAEYLQNLRSEGVL